MQQQLGLPAKFYIMKIGHNLGDLHEKALKVPKLNQFTCCLYISFCFSWFEFVVLSETCTVDVYLLNLQNYSKIEIRRLPIFVTFHILCTTPGMAGVHSRDQLLLLHSNASVLNHGQRLQLTSLGLRRRGCRADNHCRRSLLAAHSNEMQ